MGAAFSGGDATMKLGGVNKAGKPIKYDLGGQAPPPASDLTDAALGASRRAQMLRMLTSRGRGSTFLTGPMGDQTTPKLSRPSLLGGGY